MTAGNNPKIDLRLSQESQGELRKFLHVLEQVQQTVKGTNTAFKTVSASIVNNAKMLQGLKADMKQLQLISEAMKRNAVMQTGAGSYLKGQQFRTDQSADRTARLGTNLGQEIALQKEGIALAKEGLRFASQRNLKQQVFNLDLKKSTDSFRQITSIEKARALMQVAALRRGGETIQGNKEQARQAERIYRLAEARVRMLEKERAAAQSLAKVEQKRADRLRTLRARDREMERAEAAASRRKTLERLRGDGGAGLFAIQANVMANYMAIGAARNAVVGGARFAADLDEALRNLQAITVQTDANIFGFSETVDGTTVRVRGLKDEILEVSEATKFYATDIANAAVTLGQAGFSTKEITDSIRAVALLATATGTDLSKSVDLTTSILGVFNMESAQMAGVADTLTAAVNNSKLNIDKLTLGLQYAGNTASQSGVSFEELTASLGAMANAGIRSGSTLGTGMRQILMALQKPSGKFADALTRLGLTMEDVDLRSKGLYGVMQTLKDSGFTAADAIRSFEVRAASAFNALSGNLGEVVKLERAFLNTSAAAKANETQMRALANQGRRFQANLQAVISTGIEPMVYALRDLLSWMADWMQELRLAPGLLQNVVVGVAGMGAAFLALRMTFLIGNLTKMALGLGTLISAVTGATTALGSFAAVTRVLMGPIGLISLAVGAGAMAYSSLRSEVEKTGKAIEIARTQFDNATGAMEAVASQIEMVNGRIKSLTDREDTLTENHDLLQLETEKVREQFREMGVELGENVGSVDELVGALKILRGELAKDYTLKLGATVESLEGLIKANTNKAQAIQGYFRDRTVKSPSGRRGVQEARDQAANPDAKLRDLHTARATLESIQAELLTRAQGEVGRSVRQALETDIKSLNELIALKESNISLNRQLADSHRDLRIGENKREHTDLVSRVDTFGTGARARAYRAVDGVDGATERYSAGLGVVSKLRAEALAYKEEIDLQGDKILPGVREELMQKIQNNLAEAEMFLDGLLEAAKDASKTRLEMEELSREAEAGRLASQLSLSGKPEEIRDLTKARQANLAGGYQSSIDDLYFQSGGETFSDDFRINLEKLTSEYENEQRQITEEMNSALARVLKNQLAGNKQDQEALVREIEKSGEADDRAGMRLQIASLLIEQAKMLKEQAALEVTIAEELETATQQIEQDLANGLEDLQNAGLSDEVKLAERETEKAKKALEAVIRLGDAAKTHAENAAWYKKVLVAAKEWANKMRATAALKAQGDGVGEDTVADTNFDIDDMFDDIDDRRDKNTKRINRKRGGGSNSRKRDEVDKLIDDLKSKLDVAENYLLVGQKVSGDYDNVLNDALAKVSEIHSQIGTLQNKIANGSNLTAAEQEHLNTLIDQQARMTNFIRKEEERIALIKMQQGKVGEGILLTVKAWAQENLNLAKTLQSGITDALGTAKSALADFFTTMTDGTKSGKDAFRDLAVGVIQSIQKIFAEMLAVYVLQKALGWVYPSGLTALPA